MLVRKWIVTQSHKKSINKLDDPSFSSNEFVAKNDGGLDFNEVKNSSSASSLLIRAIEQKMPVEVIDTLAHRIQDIQRGCWYPSQKIYEKIFQLWILGEFVEFEYLLSVFNKICDYGVKRLSIGNLISLALEASTVSHYGVDLLSIVHKYVNLNASFENSQHCLPLLRENEWITTRTKRRTRALPLTYLLLLVLDELSAYVDQSTFS